MLHVLFLIILALLMPGPVSVCEISAQVPGKNMFTVTGEAYQFSVFGAEKNTNADSYKQFSVLGNRTLLFPVLAFTSGTGLQGHATTGLDTDWKSQDRE
jgi:hypothetical protein